LSSAELEILELLSTAAEVEQQLRLEYADIDCHPLLSTAHRSVLIQGEIRTSEIGFNEPPKHTVHFFSFTSLHGVEPNMLLVGSENNDQLLVKGLYTIPEADINSPHAASKFSKDARPW